MTTQIWLFAGVLLCHSGLTSAECRWKRTLYSSSEGGREGDGITEQDCMDKCRADVTCKGFDYQRKLRSHTDESLYKRCRYYDTVKILKIDLYFIHYDWICDNDPCGANPCRNGATCIANGKSFQCSCQNDYTGTHCEMKRGCQWKESPDSEDPQTTILVEQNSLSDCQTNCLLYSNCKAVDWRESQKMCMFRTSQNLPEKSGIANHYDWVCND